MNLPNLRQTLIEYTEKRLPIRYREVDEADNLAIVRSMPSSLEEHLRVAAIVRQGLHYLIYRAEKAAVQASVPVAEGCLVAR
ncbi:MAG: hypothetical protein HC895_16020 [Leptolyngbyaceae cyanobacterium SM1_3_5]|nr:hypothetical protein [Leptolyngbyaceae cyanobacterium SM1_3_5]